jgi:hypothetical protein
VAEWEEALDHYEEIFLLGARRLVETLQRSTLVRRAARRAPPSSHPHTGTTLS